MAKTKEQIQALFENWKNDPCWDLYDAEGFEEHRDELKKMQEEYEAECERKAQEAKEADARGLFSMDLHDTKPTRSGWLVTRVPGGWIYHGTGGGMVFVPYYGRVHAAA